MPFDLPLGLVVAILLAIVAVVLFLRSSRRPADKTQPQPIAPPVQPAAPPVQPEPAGPVAPPAGDDKDAAPEITVSEEEPPARAPATSADLIRMPGMDEEMSEVEITQVGAVPADVLAAIRGKLSGEITPAEIEEEAIDVSLDELADETEPEEVTGENRTAASKIRPGCCPVRRIVWAQRQRSFAGSKVHRASRVHSGSGRLVHVKAAVSGVNSERVQFQARAPGSAFKAKRGVAGRRGILTRRSRMGCC